jgi:hypothetical protein
MRYAVEAQASSSRVRVAIERLTPRGKATKAPISAAMQPMKV